MSLKFDGKSKAGILRVVKTLFSLSVLAFTVGAQTFTPQQIEQAKKAVQSGGITPEAINAAKAQYPELRNYSDQDIQKEAEQLRQSEANDASADPNKPSDSKTANGDEDEKKWKSEKQGGGTVAGVESADSRFPAGLARFGADFFKNTDGATVGANSPALPEYVLSPGDEIQVYTWGRDSRNQAVVVDNDGMFNFPPLAPLRVAGLRFAAAQKLIADEIQKIHGVTASIGLGKLRSIRVMVLGEAVSPGSFVLSAGTTVTTALFRSGGVSAIGSLRNIEVRRSGKIIATLDLYDMLLRGSSKGDIQLLPGDVIFIPLAKVQVAVDGMVKRPAIYEVKGGLKALDAIELAGGLQSSAFKGRIRIDRVQGNKRNVVLDVDMEKVNAASNVVLQDGDILYIDRVLGRVDDVVYLQGNVNRPGRFQYKKGMTVRDLLPSLKDLKPETFFEYAHIRRPAPDDDRPILLNFSLADVFSKGLKIPLEPRDVVVVYSRYDVVERPNVSVTGMVRKPGIYPYSEAMSVSDLVILGGGLGDAYLPEAHLIRQLPAEQGDSLYTKIVRVNLKAILENPASEENLPLAPFDELRVFSRQDFLHPKSVFIYGAVRNEGTFELSEGMGIPELAKLAGGFTKNSYKLSLEVTRRTVVKDSVLVRTIQKMNLKELLDGTASFELQDGDRMYVREVINSREYTSIVLLGEFNFPGRYEFMPGEKLSSVIQRAGGFTRQAYLRGAVFLRESVKQQQLLHAEEVGRRLEGQLQARLQQATDEAERNGLMVALQRRGQLLAEIQRAPYLGRVVVKIDSKLKFAGTDWDVELENGDVLRVGSNVSTVSVLGEVSSPTTLIHTRKTNQVGEVLSQAGGVNIYGDYNETFYVAPDGVISTPRSMPWYASFKCKAVEPGGTIIVPLKPPSKDYLEIWAKATQILYQLAITVGVANTLF
jgi:polysaccharide export outer membrane protein